MAHTKYYTPANIEVPSVTTIIGNNLGWNKNMLIAWSKKLALKEGRDSEEVTKEAGEIGTITHYLCECKIKNETPDISLYKKEYLKQAKNGYLAFCDWEKEWRPDQYVHSEIQLVNNKYLYGGTIDLVVKKNNELHILDLKTSNHIHPEMVIQLAAYKHLYEENNKDKIKSMGIIKLSKKEQKYEFYPITTEQCEAGWKVFLSLLEVEKYKSILSKFGKGNKSE